MNAPKPLIRVVAALIENERGQILITQRRPQSFMPLRWEFPGGKVEAGELDQAALARELHEELGIDVLVLDEFMSLVHPYPSFDIDFHVYRCQITSGKLQSLAVNDFRWVALRELDSFEFPPADQPTVERLLKQ